MRRRDWYDEPVTAEVSRSFKAGEKRDWHGRWSLGGGSKPPAPAPPAAPAKDYSFAPFTVKGDTAHYHDSLGIDRSEMPQLSGNVKGEYQSSKVMQPKFLDWLSQHGVKAEQTTVDPEDLKATQTTGDIKAIQAIANELNSGEMSDTKPIVISSDNRVLDGHHNWAARRLLQYEGGGHKSLPHDMPVIKVDADIWHLLGMADKFAAEQGIARRKTGEMANPKFAGGTAGAVSDRAKVREMLDKRYGGRIPVTDAMVDAVMSKQASRFNPSERRDFHGKWTKGGAGAIAKTVTGHRPGGGSYIAEQLKHSETRPGNLERLGGADSLTAHTTASGKLTPERQALHDRIVAELLAGHMPQANPRATFLGGGSASGKSTVFGSGSGLPSDAVLIDADELKGKLPEYNQMLKAKDPRAAAYVHEESSALSKRIMLEAMGQKYHFTLDGTGDGSAEKMMQKIEQAKGHGYRVDGKYVSVATDTAVERAMARAKQTGRMVPEPVIREIHKGVSETLAELVARDGFDSLQLWDTGGAKPVLVGEKPHGGRWGIEDQSAWQKFLDKRHE